LLRDENGYVSFDFRKKIFYISMRKIKSICFQNVKLTICLLSFLSYLMITDAQSVVQVVTNPASPWTVPAGVSTVKVELWGGGGAGGGALGIIGISLSGGGGGGGAYISKTYPVSAGQQYTITKGTGGTCDNSADGRNGTSSSFSGNSISLTANGGLGGKKGVAVNGDGGSGGIGDYNGGKGGKSSGNGAGGGGGAGNLAKGGDGSNTAAGIGGIGTSTSYYGGNGGGIVSSANNGIQGNTIGGGGGGAKSTSIFNGKKGGSGGDGQVVLTYIVCDPPSVVVSSPTICASTGSALMTATPEFTGVYNYSWSVPGGATNPGNTSSFNATVAGSYTVVLTDALGCTSSSSGILTINANPSTPTAEDVTATYDGMQHFANATAPAGSSIIWYTTATGTTTTSTNYLTDAGSLPLWAASVNNSTSCQSNSRTEITITVLQKEVSIGGSFTAYDKAWDGNTDAVINTNNLSIIGKISGDNLSLSNIEVDFQNANIENNKKVSITAASLTGTDAGNYSLNIADSPETTANITLCDGGVWNITQNLVYCDNDGSALQDAIDAATSGDSIITDADTYTSFNAITSENLTFLLDFTTGCDTIIENMMLNESHEIITKINTLDPCGGYDQYHAIGTIHLNGATLTLINSNNTIFPTGSTITLIKNEGNETIQGTFSGNYSFYDGINYWGINYAGGSGNDVTLTTGELATLTYCQSDIEEVLEIGSCTKAIEYSVTASGSPAPTYSFYTTGATILSGSGTGSGSIFNRDTTYVTVVASNIHATDTCKFKIIINDEETPVIIAGPDTSSVTSADGTGDATVVINIPDASFSDNCSGASISWIMSGVITDHGDGQVGAYAFPAGRTVIAYTLKDAAAIPNSATDTLIVTVVDDESPVFENCADIRTITTTCDTNDIDLPAFSSNLATTTYSVFSESPNNGIIQDNCPILEVYYQDEVSGFYKKIVIRHWMVIDQSGDTMRCTQQINLNPPCTGESFTYQGETYDMVLVGTSCWTKQNMKNSNYATGDEIAFAKGYYYEDESDMAGNIAKFGRLYTWYSAVNLPEGSMDIPQRNSYGHVQGICPDGWYLPEEEQYLELLAYGADDIKSDSLWLNNQNGNNSTGFSALPGGFYNTNTNSFYHLFGDASFWFTTYTTLTISPCCSAEYNCPEIKFVYSNKAIGNSIRCVKECD